MKRFLQSALIYCVLSISPAGAASEVPVQNTVYIWGDLDPRDPDWTGAENISEKISVYEQAVVALDIEGAPVHIYPSTGGGEYINFPADLKNLRDIAIGKGFVLLVSENGVVSAFGDGSSPGKAIPVELEDVVDVEAGDQHAMALAANGTLYSWGVNALASPLKNVVSMHAGPNHSAAVTDVGEIVIWGSNEGGQLDVPNDLGRVKQVGCGERHTVALLADGTVRMWGSFNSSLIARVPDDLADVERLAVGWSHTIALKTDGSFTGWGSEYDEPPAAYGNLDFIVAGSGISIAITRSPVISTQPPFNIILKPGAELQIPLSVSGPGPLMFQWFYNNQELADAKDSELIIPRMTKLNEGRYFCRISNANGQLDTDPIDVLVPNGELAIFAVPPESITVMLGEPFELSVEAGGLEPITYQWYKNGEKLENKTEPKLEVASASFDDSGEYSLSVRNERRDLSTADSKVEVVSPPVFLSSGGNRDVGAGSLLELQFEYYGTEPINLQWTGNDQPLVGETGSILSISNAQSEDAGAYRLVLENEHGMAVSDPIAVTVLPTAPKITEDPGARAIQIGRVAPLGVRAQGSEPLHYQWLKNGVVIAGANEDRLVISEFSLDDIGVYKVEIGNLHGTSISGEATLSVLNLPDGELDIPDLGYEILPFEFTGGAITAITHAGDGSGRLFVATRSGTVWVVKDGRLLEEPLLDLSDALSAGNESGLLSVVFPPSFPDRGCFYAAFTPRIGDAPPRLADDSLRVSRFAIDPSNPNKALVESEEMILDVPQEQDIHYGGQLAFGLDGMLYFGIGDDARPAIPGRGSPDGDQGAARRAQMLGEFYGKILRIDPENVETGYGIPEDNPFVGVEGALPEIWTLGLRNPWRFSFDEITGDCFIGDVGDMTWEELNYVSATSGGGQNFGWDLFEGPDAKYLTGEDGLTFPIFSYERIPSDRPNTQTLASIIGGYVYRGTRNERMHGLYFFGDFGDGTVYSAARKGGEWRSHRYQRAPGDRWARITTFGTDEDGELYVVAPPLSVQLGRIARIYDTRRAIIPRIMVEETGSKLAALYHDHPITLILESDTPGAVLRYTLDGSEPTEESAAYAEPLWIDRAVALSVRAYREDLEPSLIVREDLSFGVRITVSPEPYLIEEPVPIEAVASTDDAMIRFTNDGSEPTEDSPVFVSPGIVNPAETLKFQGFRDGFSPSEVWEVFFPGRIVEPVVVQKLAGTGNPGFADGPTSSAQFNLPSGLLWESGAEALLVADSGNHRVRRIEGMDATTVAGAGFRGGQNGPALRVATLDLPISLAWSVDGDLLFGDFGNRRVRVLSPDGIVTDFSSDSISGLGQIVVRGDGKLFVGSDSGVLPPTIRILTRNSQEEIFFTSEKYARDGGLEGAIGLALLPDGFLLAASEGPVVLQLSPGGDESFYSGSASGHSDGPLAAARFMEARSSSPAWLRVMASDPDGSVLISDGGWVRRLGTDGKVSTLIIDGAERPILGDIRGLSVADDGTVYASDGSTHSIYRIAADTDRDGIADIDETSDSGLQVGVNESLIDSDGDGLSDAQEFQIGTSSSDASDRPRLLLEWNQSDSRLGVMAPVYKGQRSIVESSTNLVDWLTEAEWVGESTAMENLSLGQADGQRFYRLRVRNEFVR